MPESSTLDIQAIDFRKPENRKWLRAPFPWFGGKSRVARIVWERFGDVRNYVEPFCGSCAVLLGRPHWPFQETRIETVNDKDALLANFWRSLQKAPDEVAYWADWPVNEADLHARHRWLIETGAQRVERIKEDPDFYDAKVAGWWVWGISAWIGSGWCEGYAEQLPHLGDPGRGIHRPSQQLPHLGGARQDDIYDYMQLLALRLRRVRVCCGDWTRVLGPTPTVKNGVTGVFLDPPYSNKADRDDHLYREEDLTVAAAVREWAIAHGHDPRLRIALCGYEGEHDMPKEWECVAWKAPGGYGTQSKRDNGRGKANCGRERIWFSPHCLKPPRSRSLFDSR